MNGSRTRSALLLMDLQSAVVGTWGGDAAMLMRLSKAATAARAHDIPVIYVAARFRPHLERPSQDSRGYAPVPADSPLLETNPGSDIHPGIAPHDGELTVVKRRVSAFSGSDLEIVLRTKGVGELVLSGVSTSGVVLSTVRAAADMDYRLVVLSDGCADLDENVHRTLLEVLFPRQATVLTIADWIASLDS
jgi:nicotinamidase-related amidase